MRIRNLLIAAVIGAIAAASTFAFAASPHFKKGGTPTCTISASGTNSTSTTCTGTLAGLGNADVTEILSVNGFAVYQCQNAGGNIAPGQNKVLIGPATSQTTQPADQIKNGNLTFTTNPAVLSAPTTVSAQQAGCPNDNWTGVNPTLTVTDITLKIYQPYPSNLLFTCTASNPNGLSGTVTLTC